MAGILPFTYMQLGKETVAGTAVAATRMLFPDGSGMINVDRMQALTGGNRGTRSNIVRATQMGIAVTLPFKTAADVGIAFDELPIMGSQLKGGVTGSGAGADKAWAFAPSQTGANAQESYTVEVGDPTQEFEVEYCQASGFKLSAARGGLTQGEIDWFGRQPTKSTKTAVAATNSVKIPGYLWKVRFAATQAGITGASDVTNFLRSYALDVQTGLTPQFYLDGNAYFGQSQESQNIGGTIELVIDSNAQAITQFYDKSVADTVDFIQLLATGPTLGSSTYIAKLQMAVLYEEPEIISGDIDGVNTYKVVGHIAYDPTWAQALTMDVTCSLAALP
jgi:hypothetical protein